MFDHAPPFLRDARRGAWTRRRLCVIALCGVIAQIQLGCGSSRRTEDAPPATNDAYIEGQPGDPKVVGCADGQREGFADAAAHPAIAGCVGTWEGPQSLRAPATGEPCGDDKPGLCGSPADTCAIGWHVCGNSGDKYDLRARTTASQCDRDAGPGRFNAAMSHSPEKGFPCPPVLKGTPLPCMDEGVGSEPVCCGTDCQLGGCRDGVFRGETKISIGAHSGCGAVFATNNGGVLCCRDEPLSPSPEATHPPESAPDPSAASPRR